MGAKLGAGLSASGPQIPDLFYRVANTAHHGTSHVASKDDRLSFSPWLDPSHQVHLQGTAASLGTLQLATGRLGQGSGSRMHIAMLAGTPRGYAR